MEATTTTRRLAPSAGAPPRQAFRKLLIAEARLAWRVPVGLIYGLAVPVLLLVIFAAIPAFRKPSAALGGLTYLTIYIPILLVFIVAIVALVGLSPPLAGYREQGVLRRLSTTPAPPSWVLGAQLLINLAVAIVGLALLLGISIAMLNVHVPSQLPGFILSLALTALALFAIGLWVAAIARSAQIAGVIGSLLFYAMMFFAGLWLPQERMPAVLHDISNYTPLGAAVQALQSSMQGSSPGGRPLLVLVAFAAVFGYAALRCFRWE